MAVLPRLMTVEGVGMAIENGVGRDMLSSGMATIADAKIGAETLALTSVGYRYIISVIGRSMLEDAGVHSSGTLFNRGVLTRDWPITSSASKMSLDRSLK